ncbi:fimbrial biogenesis chaperone [Pseudoalteromonas distincta]|uniref:fimbrial biogenesis chaperone n=1 Tax=Pseudoalteromonas distincta TaxID=77608 RepID=UPI0032E1698D
MKISKILILLVGIILLIPSFYSHANLLISPTRVTFDERQRVATVVVINNSDEHRTYRLSWQEKTAKPTGGYITLGKDTVNPTALSNMIRMSPSQVRLAPGERQTVKLALRKPQGLKEQEYRSHLLFQALPNESKNNGAGIKVNLILSYSIPVILRQGTELPVLDIKSVVLKKSGEKKSLFITIAKQGNYSSFGKIEVFYKPNNSGKEVKVAMVSDYSIYPEVPVSKLPLVFFEGSKIENSGKLRVVYSGLKEYRGKVFSEKTVDIDANSLGLLH